MQLSNRLKSITHSAL